jgi:hypothetical protein
VIDPTCEMAAAYETARRAYFVAQDHTAVGLTVAEHHQAACLAGLAAVFALFERDCDVKRKVCGNRGFAGASGCWRELGHEGNHLWSRPS